MYNILDIIFPQVCGFCGKLNDNALCKKCEIILNKHKLSCCDFYENNFFDEHFYLFKYENIIRNILIKYKFQDCAYLYRSIVNYAVKDEKLCEFFKDCEIVIPIPVSRKRLKFRGYNQCDLLAKRLAYYYGKNYRKDVLIKCKNAVPQSSLNKADRKINVQGVFKIKNSNNLKNKSVILIDDIFTTGSTVNEASRILKLIGISKIKVFTIAKD